MIKKNKKYVLDRLNLERTFFIVKIYLGLFSNLEC